MESKEFLITIFRDGKEAHRTEYHTDTIAFRVVSEWFYATPKNSHFFARILSRVDGTAWTTIDGINFEEIAKQ